MSEIDQVKEEISYLKPIIPILLSALFAIAAWVMLYDNIRDTKTIAALIAFFMLAISVVFLHLKIRKLIIKLKDL